MNRKVIRATVTVILIVFAVGQLFPLFWLLDFSLAKRSDLFGSNILVWPSPPQWGNYVRAWVDGHIPQYFINSLIVNLLSIALTIFLSFTMAYAFTRMHWKLSKFFFLLVMIFIMIPIHSTLLPNYIIFSKIKINNTYLGLIIPYVAFAIPQACFIMTGFMHGIPKSVEESAVLDGCGMPTMIFRIVFPMVRPAVVTVTIMTFISTWNEFIMAATFISDNSLRTLPYAVYNFAGQYSSDYSVQFAVMMLVALPSLIVYALLSDKITAGITEGALKR